MTQFELQVLQVCAFDAPCRFDAPSISRRGQEMFGTDWCVLDAHVKGRPKLQYARTVALALGRISHKGLIERVETDYFSFKAGGSTGWWEFTDLGHQLIQSLEASS